MDLAKGISKDPEKCRSELIEAAERIFAAKGYEETTVSDIVKEINVAQGTFCYYFGSNDEVMEAMIEKDLEALEHKVTGILESQESPEKKLSDVVNRIIGTSATKKDIRSYHHDGSSRSHERLERRIIARLAPLLTGMLSEGSRKGDFDHQHSEDASEFILVQPLCTSSTGPGSSRTRA
jgi:AcrR family transcriptional regulator